MIPTGRCGQYVGGCGHTMDRNTKQDCATPFHGWIEVGINWYYHQYSYSLCIVSWSKYCEIPVTILTFTC